MRKLLFIIPIIFGTFCINQSFADEVGDALLGADTGGDSCTRTENMEICYYQKPGGTSGNSTACNDKSDGDNCTSTGTQTAKCQYNGGDTLRCTAKTCKDGYHLWVTSARSKKPVKSYEDYQSNGVCVPDNWCEIQGCPDCKLHIFQSHKKSATDKVCYKITATNTQSDKETNQSTLSDTPGDESAQQQITTPTISTDGTEPDNKKTDTNQSNTGGITAEGYCTKKSGCATTTIFDQIDDKIKYLNDTKLSVWRDADGNFNTARLASDSIAGVVLGTAGGVITSKIVKKNQIKNGFEDLKCTIGGQVVATYGDEFTVGVK